MPTDVAPPPETRPAPEAQARRGLHPALWALAAGLAVLLVAFVPPLWRLLVAPPGPAPAGAGAPGAAAAAGGLPLAEPWGVQPQPDGGSRVMGLRLGEDTLATLAQRLGDPMQPAVVAQRHEAGALEALVEPFSAGFVTGRLVLAFDAPAGSAQRWRDGATRSEAMEGGARRFLLTPAARQEAASARLVGISFVPTIKLGADDVVQRFGAPAQRLTLPDAPGPQYALYPALGLVVALQPGSRAVLQYVAPRDFDARLLAPLQRAGAQPQR